MTRKISLAAARIRKGLQSELVLGNLEAERDWGFAPEFVQAMWLILQQAEPQDYVLATGRTHSVREFLAIAFEHVGLDWRDYYRQDPRFNRPADAARLLGNAAKAKARLGWEARTSLRELARIMVEHDLNQVSPPARG